MDISEINNEIKDLESADTNWGNVQRLALLYTVRDQLPAVTSTQGAEVEVVNEFTDACCGVCIRDLIQILDEHMKAIKAIYPKEYKSLIGKIRSAKDE